MGTSLPSPPPGSPAHSLYVTKTIRIGFAGAPVHVQVRTVSTPPAMGSVMPAVWSHGSMIATKNHDASEWRSRLAHALKASFTAMDARASPVKVAKLQEHIRTLEREGQERGFLPVDSAHG